MSAVGGQWKLGGTGPMLHGKCLPLKQKSHSETLHRAYNASTSDAKAQLQVFTGTNLQLGGTKKNC